MAKHFIIMSSSYTDGTRIALDICDGDIAEIGSVLGRIKQECGADVPLSTHMIETERPDWSAVVAYDSFFEDVRLMSETEDFIAKIQESRTLTGLDVAAYILSKVRCTHLSLEKLVYFCYADYLCRHDEPLFDDRIYAFDFGPVVKSVYERYKRYGYTPMGKNAPLDDDPAVRTDAKELPATTRIMFSARGAQKLQSINETLRRYRSLSASDLVGLTHRPGSPWSQVEHRREYELIPDQIIKSHHHIEVL